MARTATTVKSFARENGRRLLADPAEVLAQATPEQLVTVSLVAPLAPMVFGLFLALLVGRGHAAPAPSSATTADSPAAPASAGPAAPSPSAIPAAPEPAKPAPPTPPKRRRR